MQFTQLNANKQRLRHVDIKIWYGNKPRRVPKARECADPLPADYGVWGSVDRKLPQRGLGRNPSRKRFWCILALKSDISGGINFNDYPENQLTKFCAVYTVNAIYANRDKNPDYAHGV